MEDNLITQLSETEKAELETLEGVIERGKESFMEVGNALSAIRDQRLYREDFKYFNDYCKEKWGMDRDHAGRLIRGAQAATNLKRITLPCGSVYTPCEIQPINEYQIRPLGTLEPAQQCEVWEEAVRSADGKVITYRHVKALVTELIGPGPPKPKEHPRYTNAVHIVLGVIAHLEGIQDDDHRREEAFLMLLKWIDKNRKRRVR